MGAQLITGNGHHASFFRKTFQMKVSTVAEVAVDPASVQRVMALVMRRLDATGPTDLVVKLGISKEVPNAPRLAANWIAGTNGPRFDYAMTMLSEAGLLTADAEQAWRGIDVDPAAEAQAGADASREAEERGARAARIAPRRRRRETG